MSIKSVSTGGGGGGNEGIGGGGGKRPGGGGEVGGGSYRWGDAAMSSPGLVSSEYSYVGGGESRDTRMGLGGS